MAAPLSQNDPSSFSEPENAVITHIHLNLDVDFKNHQLKGVAKLDFEKRSDELKSVLLDTRDLTIHKVTDSTTGKELIFTLDDPVLSFGSKLEIQPDQPIAQKFSVNIEYETSTNSTALQWLQPAQTAGKKHPYLFSQCQAIHARSMLPCQDTPAVKMPYSAAISAPSELTVLMSAVRDGTEVVAGDTTKTSHKFLQKIPMPSYLIAIVAGALESRDIGPRSKVWSEKEMVDAAAYEFGETETMLATAEELLGPYVWGVYDLLVLPPSFPYGGMENPCLTFVTPTLLAGDRSLADVVAHEISHSWTGNLVTNKNPEHFWLNEGHTRFVERKIVGIIKGKDKADRQRVVGFLARGGWRDLLYQVNEVFGAEHPYTQLVPKLVGVDPDDAFSAVPYEKGSTLLFYLEQKLGGPDVFEPFLRAYIEKFKYKSITTDDWKTFLYEFFIDKRDVLDSVDWEAWFHKSGMPPVKPDYDTSMSEACQQLASRWSKAGDSELDSFTSEDLSDMSACQVKEFLAGLIEEPPLSEKKLQKMESVYKFNDVKNSETKFRWLRLCLRGKKEDAVNRAIEFVNEQGRMKFVRPLYRDLYGWEKVRQVAIDNFKQKKGEMHCLTATMVGKDLQVSS